MRKAAFLLILLAVLIFASCGQVKNWETTKDYSEDDIPGDAPYNVLYEKNVDLDGDGMDEKIQVLSSESEYLIRIRSESSNSNVSVVRKQKDGLNPIGNVLFTDLDSDAFQDVFVVLRDIGNPFVTNCFFMYDYKNERSYLYSVDDLLKDFTGGFEFQYEGNGKLNILHDAYDFKAVFDLSRHSNYSPDNEEANRNYERSWVEPLPVEIFEDSGITVLENTGGKTEIRVPLPVFGLSTSDVIGEVDLYFTVNSEFKPIMKRFSVLSLIKGDRFEIGRGCVQ